MPRALRTLPWLWIALLLAWTLAPPAGAAQRRVAILDFRNVTGDAEFSWLATAVPETLTTKLNAVRSIRLIERAQLNKIVKEQKTQLSDLTDPATAVKLGRMAGAQVVILGSFTRFRGRILFNLRFIDVETTTILHTAQARGSVGNEDMLFDSLNELADAAIKALNKRAVLRGGETRVAPAAPEERIAPTPGERKRLHRPPAASLNAFQLYGKGLEAKKRYAWDDAIRLFGQTLEKDPDHTGALLALGEVQKGKGRIEEALGSFGRALDL